MSEARRIKTALVSVYHKEGLDEIITKLHEEGVEFLSTGGTRQFIESLGYPCKAVEDLTTYPSILGGRVKKLHPKVSVVSFAAENWNKISSRLLSTKFRKLIWSLLTSIRLKLQ